MPSPGPAPAGHGSSTTHGFLFADLRDYTAYVDVHGDHAGAELLERYQALVRECIAGTAGAEVRTEGDSFYVVFDSASAAVACGLAILAAAGATEGDAPIRVGVGVHAGETVETAAGFVGSAVNIAARLCAEAKAGELVVSETVRGLTRTYLDVAFEPLGPRRLKGIVEPVACYRVTSRTGVAGSPPSPVVGRRRLSWPVVAGLGVALVAVAVVAAVVLGGDRAAGPPPDPSAGAGASATAASAASTAAPAASTAAPAAPATLGPFPTDAEAAIMAALPADVVSSCRRGGTSDDARQAGFVGTVHRTATPAMPQTEWQVTPEVRAGVTCQLTTGAARLYLAEPIRPTGMGSDGRWGDEFLSRLTARWTIPLGSCATDPRAYERWSSPRGTGLLACMNPSPHDGRPWVYFTFGGGRYLGFATRDDANYDALYQWFDSLKTFLP